MELIKFIFSNGWIFTGTILLLVFIANIFKEFRLFEITHNHLYMDGKERNSTSSKKTIYDVWEGFIKNHKNKNDKENQE